MDSNRRKSYSLVALSLALVMGFGWSRWNGEAFRRPLVGDEVITLKYYTWAGVEPSGGPRTLRRIGDFYSLPSPSARHVLIGLYCSLGRWTEPNNHVLNSSLMNLSLLSTPRDAAGARLPALLGALVLAGLLAWGSGVLLGSFEVAPLAVMWVSWCPYVVTYSQEARGYTWMMALQVASLVSIGHLTKRPSSLSLGSAAAAAAALSFMNVVSLAVDWLLPLYASLLYWPPNRDATERVTWRKNIAAQALAIGAVGFVFLMDRLPYVYSSAEQYGIEAHAWQDRTAHLVRVVEYLFPTPAWKVFAVCGLIGLALPVGRRSWFLPKLAVAVFAVGLLHLFLARRMPYQRVYGYILPLFLFGGANLACQALGAARTTLTQAAAWVVLIAGTLSLAGAPAPTGLRAADLARLGRAVAAQDRPVYCLVTPDPYKEWITLYLPRDWGDLSGIPPSPGQVELLVLCHDEPVATQPAGAAPWDPSVWSGRSLPADVGPYRLVVIRGSISRLSDASPDGGRALILWYPDPSSVAVFPRPALEILERYRLRYLTQEIRHQVKLDVFGRLGDVVLIANSPEEYRIATAAAEEGLAQCGGTALVFTPEPPVSERRMPAP